MYQPGQFQARRHPECLNHTRAVLPEGSALRSRRMLCTQGVSVVPSHAQAWAKNARIARTNPESYFSQIARTIADNKPRHFRWHVAGDIFGVGYLHGMCEIAERNPRTRFLAITKAFNIVNGYENSRAIPGNLTVIFSAWPGMRIVNPHEHRIAWMQDGSEHRVPENAIRCPGFCETCGMCFELPRLGRDVVFNRH
jgi:hypothetical protein